VLEPQIARPAARGDHGELEIEPFDAVPPPRDLARGHAVARRARHQPDERVVARRDPRSFDVNAADRVRPVEHDERFLRRGARAHREHHRPHEGVIAAADVLDVEHHDVDGVEHRGRRRERRRGVAVERMHRQPRRGVFARVDADHVLRVAAHAVLGTEQRRQPVLCAE
jgi:hypothetical protein